MGRWHVYILNLDPERTDWGDILTAFDTIIGDVALHTFDNASGRLHIIQMPFASVANMQNALADLKVNATDVTIAWSDIEATIFPGV